MTQKIIHSILEVDLTSGACLVRPLDEKILKDYIGGLGLGIKILFDQVGADVDPLSPENIIVIVPGPLSGTDAPASGRTQIVTKGESGGRNSEKPVLKRWLSETIQKVRFIF
jgi:aldehyde:ferredoxin oxidoreductase